MKRHKDKALEDTCLCDKCSHKFECFTQERIFSDPILQGLFEALMAKGRTREEALEDVMGEIKLRIGSVPAAGGTTIYDVPWTTITTIDGTTSAPTTIVNNNTTTGSWYLDWSVNNRLNLVDVNGSTVTYHMASGDDVSWSCSDDECSRFN